MAPGRAIIIFAQEPGRSHVRAARPLQNSAEVGCHRRSSRGHTSPLAGTAWPTTDPLPHGHRTRVPTAIADTAYFYWL